MHILSDSGRVSAHSSVVFEKGEWSCCTVLCWWLQSDLPLAGHQEPEGDELWPRGEGQPWGGANGPQDGQDHLRHGLRHHLQVGCHSTERNPELFSKFHTRDCWFLIFIGLGIMRLDFHYFYWIFFFKSDLSKSTLLERLIEASGVLRLKGQ